jgi:hypothetical protein
LTPPPPPFMVGWGGKVMVGILSKSQPGPRASLTARTGPRPRGQYYALRPMARTLSFLMTVCPCVLPRMPHWQVALPEYALLEYRLTVTIGRPETLRLRPLLSHHRPLNHHPRHNHHPRPRPHRPHNHHPQVRAQV